MACVFEGNITFVDAPVLLPPDTTFSSDYENYSISINSDDVSYELNFIGQIGTQSIVYAVGGSLGAPVFPTASVIVANGQYLISYGENSLSEITPGTFYISICEKESDDDSCPEVPLSESIPEKYADYIDDNGNFVPKASSGGGGDCPFTTATLSIVDENGEQPDAEVPEIISPIPYIDDGEFVCVIPDSFGDYIVPLYNGEIAIRTIGEILSSSGNIEIGKTMILTGDATISVPTGGNA